MNQTITYRCPNFYLAAQTAKARQEINSKINGIQDVNSNVVHGSQVASDISQDIVEVTQASEEVSQNSSKVHESAANLAALAEDLNAKLAQFRIKDWKLTEAVVLRLRSPN